VGGLSLIGGIGLVACPRKIGDVLGAIGCIPHIIYFLIHNLYLEKKFGKYHFSWTLVVLLAAAVAWVIRDYIRIKRAAGLGTAQKPNAAGPEPRNSNDRMDA
jgi:hypothetical protein